MVDLPASNVSWWQLASHSKIANAIWEFCCLVGLIYQCVCLHGVGQTTMPYSVQYKCLISHYCFWRHSSIISIIVLKTDIQCNCVIRHGTSFGKTPTDSKGTKLFPLLLLNFWMNSSWGHPSNLLLTVDFFSHLLRLDNLRMELMSSCKPFVDFSICQNH